MDNKIRKLTSAAYKLLDFFPESDPLKTRAKEKVLSIMSALGGSALGGENRGSWMVVGEYFSAEKEKKKIQLLEDIDILLGYFEIGKSQGWLSGVNCIIITNEYLRIKKEIKIRPELVKGPESKEQKITEKTQEKEIAQTLPLPEITGRQKEIIEYLIHNKKAQVMDLQRILPDVTKRTIRRDLDELLKMGRIRRFGEFNQVFYRIV